MPNYCGKTFPTIIHTPCTCMGGTLDGLPDPLCLFCGGDGMIETICCQTHEIQIDWGPNDAQD